MKPLTKRDIEHIFQALRNGLVPERGIDNFAVGIEKQRGELHRQLSLVGDGEGSIKFLRGGYGCGKTFMARLALLDAQEKGFATSFVVVSDNDLRFHRFDDVYKHVLTELATVSCPRGALNDILDRWIAAVEDSLIGADEDPNADGFDTKVRSRINDNLHSMTGGKAPQDFVRVIQTIFDLKQMRDYSNAGALISWLCGSGNVAASAKRLAEVKGEIGSREALDYLRGVLEIVKAAGYRGLVIVIDEAETILRMRQDVRHKSLNGIRQIADASVDFPGLLWLLTGTPEFFDTRHGVKGLAPLHDRIGFTKHPQFQNYRQPQLELLPFDADRLKNVAKQLRDLFPAADKSRLLSRISDGFIERLVADVTKGFKGDVGVVPRQFLRAFVNEMDLVDQNEDYDPMVETGFQPVELTAEEQLRVTGAASVMSEPSSEPVPVEDVW
ncbi:MAG: BREX system ATP-binding protein BrxD [Planctomycetia bacterium]